MPLVFASAGPVEEVVRVAFAYYDRRPCSPCESVRCDCALRKSPLLKSSAVQISLAGIDRCADAFAEIARSETRFAKYPRSEGVFPSLRPISANRSLTARDSNQFFRIANDSNKSRKARSSLRQFPANRPSPRQKSANRRWLAIRNATANATWLGYSNILAAFCSWLTISMCCGQAASHWPHWIQSLALTPSRVEKP